MLVNEYRLEIRFKKVQKIRNINNIPTVGSRPLECKPAQNVCAEWTLHGLIVTLQISLHGITQTTLEPAVSLNIHAWIETRKNNMNEQHFLNNFCAKSRFIWYLIGILVGKWDF
jgi:hypothetical protein